MPNHVKNRLTLIGEPDQIQLALDFMKSEDEQGATDFSFSKLKVCPEEIKHRTSPFRHEPGDQLPEKELQDYLLNKYGATSWYGWSLQNWGTKWDAYNVCSGDFGTIMFDTAWSAPVPVIKLLSEKFPALEVKLEYADEDVSSNTGIIIMRWGLETKEHYPKSGSKEAFELYFDLHGRDEEWVWVESLGTYAYHEEDENDVDNHEDDE